MDVIATALMTTIVTQGNEGFTSLCNHPMQFGSLPLQDRERPIHGLYNAEFPVLAYRATHFSWAFYGFNSGHFVSTISKWNLAFCVLLACNPYEYGRALFSEFVHCPTVLPSAASLLDHIRGSGEQGPIDGYLIHSHHYQTNEPTSAFWAIQASIVLQLLTIQKLNLFVAFVHPDHDGCSVTKFVSQLKSSGWVVSTLKCLFPDYGDSIIRTVTINVGVHDSTQSRVEPVLFRIPPSPRPLPLAAFIWQPFNKCKHVVSLSMNDKSFAANVSNGVVATLPSSSVSASPPTKMKPLYYLHAQNSDTASITGTAVLSLDSLCPPFNGLPNTTMFCGCFGIKFHADDHTHVLAISPFEFTSCFGLTDQLRYRLSQPVNWYALDAGVPALTSVWIFDHIHERLVVICDSNTEIFLPNHFAAPAAHIQAFVSGVIATRIPDQACWIQAITSDPKLSKIRDTVNNPSTLNNKSLAVINYNYHAAL